MTPSLTIKGIYEQNVGFVDSDVDGEEGFHTTSDNEITFAVRTELDNGLIVRGEVELEGNTSSDQIDEAFVAVGGSFGEVRMGANDEAAYEMTLGYHGSVSIGVGEWLPPSNGLGVGSVRVRRLSDSDLIAYYTPRFSGFQFGASYTRADDGDGTGEDTDGIDNRNVADEIAAPGVGRGVRGTTQENDIVSVATNYVGKFGDVGVGIAVGYVTSDVPSQTVTGLNTSAAPEEGKLNLGDRRNWGGGIRLAFSGVRAGVGYVRYEDTIASIVDASANPGTDPVDKAIAYTSRERVRWDFGARYIARPHSFGIGYIDVSEDGSKLETSAAILAYTRTLGPGVTWLVEGLRASYEAADGTSTDGTAVTTGIRIRF